MKESLELPLSLSYKFGSRKILLNVDRTRYDSILFGVIIQKQIRTKL